MFQFSPRLAIHRSDIIDHSKLNLLKSFSVFRHHKLNLDISRSIVKGSTWLKEQQDVDGKWIDHHTTGNAISILKLTGRDFNSERALSYIKKLNGTLHLLDGGKLASVITGLRSLCIDTSYFTGTNLNNMLLEKIKSFPKGSFNHPFQYSLAVIGLRLSNSIIPHSVIGKLISDGDRVQDGDTLALISMALSGVASQGTIPMGKMWSVKSKIRKILNKLEAKMFSKNTTMNIYTKSLVMQV